MSTHTIDGEQYTIRRKDTYGHLHCYLVQHVEEQPVSYYAWPPRTMATTGHTWVAAVQGYRQPLLLDPYMELVKKLDQALAQHINNEEQ